MTVLITSVQKLEKCSECHITPEGLQSTGRVTILCHFSWLQCML